MIQIFVFPSLHGIIQMFATSAFNREPMQVGHLFQGNPLTPKSDQLLISHYNITPESNIKATSIMMIVKQILLVSTSGIVQRTVWRMFILMLGCNGLML